MSHPKPGARRLVLAPEPDRAEAETARATGAPAAETDRATLRDTARHLADQGISNREIGRRLGISKDKVKRLLDELSAEQAAGASHPEPDRAGAETARAAGEPPTEPSHEPGTEPPAAEPETVLRPDDEYLRLPLSLEMREQLEVFADAGMPPAEAIAACLKFVATFVDQRWLAGDLPRGVLPQMRITWYPPLPPQSNIADEGPTIRQVQW